MEWRIVCRPSSLSAVTIETVAPSGRGAARSLSTPSMVMTRAVLARPRPMSSARSAPVAPSGRMRFEPSGSERVMSAIPLRG